MIDEFCRELKAQGVTDLVLVMVRKPRFTVLSMSWMPKKRLQGFQATSERWKSKKETSSDCFGSAGTRTQAGADLDRMVLTPSPATTRRHTPRPHHRGGTLMEDLNHT
jgi:hypothetical protein